jgi:pimeloyl-ACP methyl ester carboxylesterase
MNRLMFATAIIVTLGLIATFPILAQSSPTVEKHLSFTSEGASFPAILTVPFGSKARFPVVVMLSGSGPQDEDEAVGSNKPFRDIALALGEKGIATLRYPKRSKIAPKTLIGDHLTLDWEYVIDARAAIEFVRRIPEVDPSQVFILGHSLGASVAPRVAESFGRGTAESISGLILLAPSVVPVDVTIRRQILGQQQQAGASPAQIAQVNDVIDAMVAKMKSPATNPDELVGIGALQLPERYWRDWLDLTPASTLKKVSIPSLIIRGLEDIQVGHEDYVEIVAAQTTGSKHAEISSVDHFFFPVIGKSTGQEYGSPNHVSIEVTDMISNWILETSKLRVGQSTK